MADIQCRLFTAQISHTYLFSLAQPPTPLRNQSSTHTNTMAELKTLQSELDALVSHCDEASRLLARQTVTNQVSDTLLRAQIEEMERELDGVERIEGTLEAMIGRTTVAKDLISLEMSKIDAVGQILSQLGTKLPPRANKVKEEASRQPVGRRNPEDPPETMALQNLIGVRDADDITKFITKGDRLDKELFDSSSQSVLGPVLEAYILPAIDPDRAGGKLSHLWQKLFILTARQEI